MSASSARKLALACLMVFLLAMSGATAQCTMGGCKAGCVYSCFEGMDQCQCGQGDEFIDNGVVQVPVQTSNALMIKVRVRFLLGVCFN